MPKQRRDQKRKGRLEEKREIRTEKGDQKRKGRLEEKRKIPIEFNTKDQ